MARRGSYAKGVAKREEILRTALDVIAERGFGGATLREIADAVGLTQAGVLHYFGNKEALLTEVLRRRDELDTVRFSGGADVAEAWRDTVRRNTQVPGLVELFTRLAAEATDDAHPAHDWFRERYDAARRTTAEGLQRLRAEGRLPRDADPDRLAVLVVALVDGLQVQWRHDPDLDMPSYLEDLWSLLGATPGPTAATARATAAPTTL